MFIRDRIDRELLHSLERLELKFGLSSEFFDKIPVRILLDVLFRPGIFIHDILNFVAMLTLRHTLGCRGNFVISHVKLQINAEISRQN